MTRLSIEVLRAFEGDLSVGLTASCLISRIAIPHDSADWAGREAARDWGWEWSVCRGLRSGPKSGRLSFCVSVYPPPDMQIDNLGENEPYSLAAGTLLTFEFWSTTQIRS
jgi:hypothetical protein